MISIKITGLIIAAVSLLAFIRQDKQSEGKGFAVVELFTSEGCSSCPPADELLAEIQKESLGKPVYLLAYHVDYWNRLGWKDVFSKAAFSERQQQYQSWLHTSTIYTPQVVINGQREFIGSDGTRLRNSIQQQISGTPVAGLTLSLHQDTLQYSATKATKGQRLLLAITQKTAQSKVSRGENAGHTLSHVQVVYSLQSEPLKEKGRVMLKVPKDYELIGFIQDQSNGEIIAAAKAE